MNSKLIYENKIHYETWYSIEKTDHSVKRFLLEYPEIDAEILLNSPEGYDERWVLGELVKAQKDRETRTKLRKALL